jgi:excinuclease ABC subunit C
MSPELEHKLDNLPSSPGVYVFKGKDGQVLYVGKARSLKSRVRSYFQEGSSDTRFFISRLSRELGDIETVVVGSEKEAALLENTLIKEHRPRYNVKLRDDKEYLSLRLDPSTSWPRLEVVRKPKADGAFYFGPYHSATAARATLRVINRHFQLRTCTDTEFAARTRPCLQFQIKRCLGPCVYEVDRAHYGEQVANVRLFLDGRHDELRALLTERMREAAQSMAYERAAEHRDQLKAMDQVHEQNRVSVVQDTDTDVFAAFRMGDQVEMAVLCLRKGRLTHVRTYALKNVSLPDDDLCAQFVGEYYAEGSFIPDDVLLPVEVEAMDGLAELLSDRRGQRVTLQVPKKGAKAQLVDMARENAAHAFREKSRAREDTESRLAQIQQRLRLASPPRRIECIDVSHTGGTDTVASIVAMENGLPDRKRYRSFHVKRVDGGDDYGAMYEVLSRRLRRGREGESGWELPDLLLVDGGRGQLNVAMKVLADLGITGQAVAGLAKEKENVLGEKLVDRVYLPGQKNPIELREDFAAFAVLAHLRDEAHRTSNALRVKLGQRKRLTSRLDEIRGIGPKTRARLLKALGSVRAIEEADALALRQAGATEAQAAAILRAFHGPLAPELAAPTPTDVQGERIDEAPVDGGVSVAEEDAIAHAFDADAD